MSKSAGAIIPVERIHRSILLIRGHKVIVDRDLADLYRVQTKVLNQAVKRNIDRFPSDFMFQLTDYEKEQVVTNCDHLSELELSCSFLNLTRHKESTLRQTKGRWTGHPQAALVAGTIALKTNCSELELGSGDKDGFMERF
jgi:hypothetical protein